MVPARLSASHRACDLRNALGRHLRLIVENPPEMVAVGKDLRLVRQVRAARIHQIDAWQTVLLGDLLRAEMLLHRRGDRKSTRLNSSHYCASRLPYSA